MFFFFFFLTFSPTSGSTSSKEPSCQWRRFKRQGLEKGMATHPSIHAWEILWAEEPGRLQSIGSQRVRHNWSDLAHIHQQIGRVVRSKSKLYETVKLLSKVVDSSYVSTSIVLVVQLLLILTNSWYANLLVGVYWVSYCGFN